MKIAVSGLTAKATAGGTRYYWQPSPTLRKAGWKPLALGRDLDAAVAAAKKRNLEVDSWRTGGAKPRAIAKFVRRETVAHVIALYKTKRLPALGEKTRIEYASKLRAIEAWAGPEPIAAITRKNILVFRDALYAPDSDGRVRATTAHATLKMLRTLLAWAKEEELVATNVAAGRLGIETPRPRDQVWSPDARNAILAAAAAAGLPNMALAMLLAATIGQREEDLLKLLHSQFVEIPAYQMDVEVHTRLAALAADGRVMGIRIRQGKTRRWVEVPVLGALRSAIEAAIVTARGHGFTTILFDERRGPRMWTCADRAQRATRQAYFQRGVAELRETAAVAAAARGDAALAAELRDLQFRDYRRTCVVVLGELGLPDHLIAAITGHSLDATKRILETYLPRTTGMAARAIMLSEARTPAVRDQNHAHA